MRTVICIAGTTSVGKSAVAVNLAQLLKTEVISADSMQVYRGMDVGTAKLTQEEMQGVKHRMLDVAEPNEQFSSFLYQQMASQIIDEMTTVPVIAGGTGFYFESLLYPPEYGDAPSERRESLRKIYKEQGLDALRRMLAEEDEKAYRTVDLNNYKRVIRAIEIAESGFSRAEGTHKNVQPRYDMKLFVLQLDRQRLYERINDRVDTMVQRGLVEEVRGLIERYGVCKTPAFEAIGYKEIVRYLQGDCTLQQAIEEIKINTRHYAKRQIAFFKRLNVAEYIDVEGKDASEIAFHIYNTVRECSDI